jgi:hypothetical protein
MPEETKGILGYLRFFFVALFLTLRSLFKRS